MPPRIHPPSKAIASILRTKRPLPSHYRQYASAASTQEYTPSPLHPRPPSSPVVLHAPTQPPSYKPPEFRKSQLLRQYASLLRSTPLLLIFQHNNMKSTEWTSLRRELSKALQKLDETLTAADPSSPSNLASGIKLQIIQTGILSAALKVVEFYKPDIQNIPRLDPTDPSTPSSTSHPMEGEGENLTHTLSKAAHAAASAKHNHPLRPLLSGPLVLLTFPLVSPQHLKTALSILSPSPGQFAAPTRRANPGYHDPAVQSALQKLILLGARVEGEVFDVEGTKWVGGIEGGIGGLRAQLVHVLQGVSGGVVGTLEGTGKALYFTVEGRRGMLEDEEKGVSGEGAVKEEAK